MRSRASTPVKAHERGLFMSKFLVVCTRTGALPPAERLRHACDLLGPRHPVAPPQVATAPGLALAVGPPSPLVTWHGTSLCLGQMLGPREGWHEPGGAVPDGSFALVRTSATEVELVSDAVASRSIYFAFADGLFAASSSQRAIVTLLGGFDYDPRALSWLLSAGSLGPEATWDARIRRLGGDARLVLDRSAWKLQRRQKPVVFEPVRRPRREHAARLRDAIGASCDRLELQGSAWRLPLSGGCDSRILLMHLGQRHRLSTVTWGMPSSLDDPRNDAAVARRLAREVGVPHEFFAVDHSEEPLDALLDRFLRNGEGCIDHLGAYMDGFDIWRRLRDSGAAGIVRGDEGFGWEEVALAPDVRRVVGASMLSDFLSPREIEALDLAPQDWPSELALRRGESLATWRDRLYHAYRIPVVLASLTDLKAPYVEVVNPLLSREILSVVREEPDALRTEKRLFRQVVWEASPPIPFATRPAIPSVRALVHTPAFLELARRELERGREEGSLPAALVEHLLPRLASSVAKGDPLRPGFRRRLVTAVRESLPRVAHSALRALRPRAPAPATLAFRAALVSRMVRDLRSAGRTD